ncbi:MAG: ribosome biogenesis GTPase YlqF [Synechococcaceae cyanobacterium]|nr:ribosome biogenesis GTPase YlqF [Synechococcaceae cyanobacterium]
MGGARRDPSPSALEGAELLEGVESAAGRESQPIALSSAAPAIQWYPGHIAKAEKSLAQQLERVDLVLEVRDARIPLATGHPRLQRWIRGRQHLLVLNRLDMITPAARQAWTDWFRGREQSVWWCDARAGTGVKQLQQAAARSCQALNARRLSRGMRPRPVRALMLGFPNVGKSALINRLVGQKVVESGRRAGVTRSLRWVRLGQELDLLDAPGVLPPRLDDQQAALRLALCDDIGQAAYDGEQVALALLRLLGRLAADSAAGVAPGLLERRYGVSVQRSAVGEPAPGLRASPGGSPPHPGGERPDGGAAEAVDAAGQASLMGELEAATWLQAAADRHTSGEPARMAQRLLDDFRRGVLGPIALELP